MPSPTPEARAALDASIRRLVASSDGLTLADFRSDNIARARRAARRIRLFVLVGSILGVLVALATLFAPFRTDTTGKAMFWAVIWAMALGGLGAISSIFLHVLKLMPNDTLNATDEFEVIGRTVLGCLFSAVLAMTLVPEDLHAFFEALGRASANAPDAAAATTRLKGSPVLLLPFLAGYSIPLVLGLLGKAIRAVELTIGLDDRRSADTDARSRPGRARGRTAR